MSQDGNSRDEPRGARGDYGNEPRDALIKTEGKSLQEMLDEALDGENIGARKLTFVEQCGAFAALYKGVRNQVVAKAFNISIQTASKLSGCLTSAPEEYRYQRPSKDGGPPVKVMYDHNARRKQGRVQHYENVWREFDAMYDPERGAEPFLERYYPPVHERIMRAKAEFKQRRRF